MNLRASLNNLQNELSQETVLRNREQQYHRTSLNVKLCGVPPQDGEEDPKSVSNATSLEVIKRVCVAAKIEYDPNAIDVCHRLGKSDGEHSSPIIIRFKTKFSRFNFFKQKHKLKGLTPAEVDLSGFEHDDSRQQRDSRDGGFGARGGFGAGRGGSDRGFGNGGFPQPAINLNFIYMQEHLTKRNKDLLKAARAALKNDYDFPGYALNGEIRVKCTENDKYIVINSEADIEKLKRGLRS